MIVTSGKREKIAGKLRGLRGNFPLFGVSALIFLLIVASYFTVERFILAYTDKNTVTEWTYTYSDDPDNFTSGSVRTYSPENPILSDRSVKRDYILFEKRLPPSDEDRTLVIITDHSPVRVYSGGTEIYNNRYGEAEYVGNSYNAVTLRGTGKEQVVEVYLKLPFSVVFDTYYTGSAHPSYTISAGTAIGAVLCAASVLSLFVPLIMSIIKKRFLYSVSVVFLLALTGAALFVFYLPRSTYLINNPIWMNITYAAPLTLIFYEQLCLLRFCRRKGSAAAVVVAIFAISAALIMVAPNLFLFNIFSIIAVILSVISSFITFSFSVRNVQNRAQITTPVVIASMIQFLNAVLCGVLIILRADRMYMFVMSLSSVSVSAVLFFASYFDNKAMKLNKIQVDINKFCGEYLSKVCDCVKDILENTNNSNYFKYTSDKIGEVISAYFDNRQVCCGVAVCEDGGYDEIINSGVKNCRYDMIVNNGAFNSKNCLISQTYVSFIIKNENAVCAVMYFEGIDDGLNAFFTKMMRYLYCGLQASYDKVFLNKDSAFALLYDYASEANESEEHLKSVHDLTYELCIELHMKKEVAEVTARAAYLHDIGKNAVSSDLFVKDGRLNEYEYITMMEHAEFGGKMISAFDKNEIIKTSADIANYHHEKYNGGGYYGLKGEDIPLSARIVSVCDVYDALVSDRPYKKRWTTKDAISFINENKGTSFDKSAAEAFVRCVSRPYIKKETV
ncbi:MAG: HD domain-containing protein [Clostridia bacterium]|nr:HD domain-containing protein [Clostridia bacterium]